MNKSCQWEDMGGYLFRCSKMIIEIWNYMAGMCIGKMLMVLWVWMGYVGVYMDNVDLYRLWVHIRLMSVLWFHGVGIYQ